MFIYSMILITSDLWIIVNVVRDKVQKSNLTLYEFIIRSLFGDIWEHRYYHLDFVGVKHLVQ